MTETRSNLSHFPALSRFYGLSFTELIEMPRVFVRAYLDAMPRIQAAETLQAMTVSAYPHLQDQPRRRLVSDLERTLALGDGERPQSVNKETFGRKVGAMGIGFKVVEKEEVTANA